MPWTLDSMHHEQQASALLQCNRPRARFRSSVPCVASSVYRYSRNGHTHSYFLRHKSEWFEKFKEFEAITTSGCGERIGTLRTDNGGEYLSVEFKTYLKSKGIRHELTVPHTQEKHGVAERKNRTLIESARSMIFHAGLPDSYWAEAVHGYCGVCEKLVSDNSHA